MARELTEGALAAIMAGGQVDLPVMQILGSKKISGVGDNERYRLLISDGQHVNSFAMLATQLNDKIRSGELSDFTIVRIKRFITSIVPNSGRGEKRVMIILDVEVIAPGSEIGCKIGNPQTLTADGQVTNKVDPPVPEAHAPPPTVRESRQPSPQRSPARPTPSNHSVFGGGYGNHIRSPSQGRGMGGMDVTLNSHTHPISSLTPYQNKWVIKARVTSKGPVRTWSNKNGEGKLFSFDLLDESGEVRVTAFKEQCDQFYDMIEVNKVYKLCRANVKTANKKFSNLNNDYELSLTSESQIIPVDEEDSSLPRIKFSFSKLSRVEQCEANTVLDVLGVVTSVGDVVTFVSRQSNKEFKKRDVTVVDDSKVSVNITLWGEQAENFDGSSFPILAVKGGRVNEFGGSKSVSLSQNSVLQINPDIPEAHELKGWYDAEGLNTSEFKCLSVRNAGSGGGADGQLITLKEARQQKLGTDKADYFSCKATVLLTKFENSIYMACPGDNCLKKVLDQNNGLYRCEKCNREYPSFVPRLLLSISIGDWSDQAWVTLFQESAEALLGFSAQDMQKFKETGDEQFSQAFQQATFKSFQFRVRAQAQNFNDEMRMRMSVVSLKPVDHKAYSKILLTQLKNLVGMGTVTH